MAAQLAPNSREDIQGDIVPGFRRQTMPVFFQAFLFASIDDPSQSREGIQALLDEGLISSQMEIEDRQTGAHRSGPGVADSYVNLAFTASGLARLTDHDLAGEFEQAFLEGLAARSEARELLGPSDDWFVGNPRSDLHVMLNIGSTSAQRLEEAVGHVRYVLQDRLIFRDHLEARGATLPGGVEHFGFRDGLAGPLVSRSPGGGATPAARRSGRTYRAAVDGETGAEPGTRDSSRHPIRPLGEFVVQCDDQRRLAHNGSYMVWLRLQQHVHRFWQACDGLAGLLTDDWKTPVGAADAAALLVGRRMDGTPLLIAPVGQPGPDDFHYNASMTLELGPDPLGVRCPLGAHVRKMNPRSPNGDLPMLIRRGIPYGPRTDREDDDDGVERGLLFVSYQASIEGQYEHLQGTWANSPNEPEQEGSPDPIIGLTLRRGLSNLELANPDGRGSTAVNLRNDWVEPRGGLYLFVPSLSVLRRLVKESVGDAPPEDSHQAVAL